MRVLVTGSNGLVGRALVKSLRADGHAVVRLVRDLGEGGSTYSWDLERGWMDAAAFDGVDAVVHLAGESIASGPWTRAKKVRIRDSRVASARLLVEHLQRESHPPAVFLSASAVGYYGDRGDEELTEESPPGNGFLPDVCREWEAAAAPLAERGIRTAMLRFGVILSADGGALARLLLPFRWGLGGVIGTGRQYMSWVSLTDAVGAIRHVLATEGLRGPVNVTAPTPVTNREFTETLGRILGRPTIVPVPAVALRLFLGEMAEELLLSGARAVPAALLRSGFNPRFPTLAGALERALATNR
jgi:uncharacterized protein (TIGR01777 family)